MTRIDPLLVALYGGVLCSIVVAVTMFKLSERLKAGKPKSAFATMAAAMVGMFAGAILLITAIEAPTEIGAKDYAMLLTTMTARPEMSKAFKAAMRDGKITELELHRIEAGFPPIERGQMRGVAQIVARDIP